MSSIAYVADEEMLEYHRLCRNRTILFWRLSSKKKFSDFRKGDLLFFFSRPHHGRKKGLVGYAHFDSTKRLTLGQMWKHYGEATGYADESRLKEAIKKAAKGSEIPTFMRCLYLTDVVFFVSPIYAEDIGVEISPKLESYLYLDRQDAEVTTRILKVAQKRGIDLWSADPSVSPDEIFRNDVVRHHLSDFMRQIGKDARNEKERAIANKLSAEYVKQKNWEMIRGSKTDCLYIDKKQIKIAVPLVYQVNDMEQRIRELFGKLTLYRLMISNLKLNRNLVFEVLYEKENKEVEELLKEFNHA